MKRHSSRTARSQLGASATEFIVVAPVLVLLGLGALQIGLIYHGKSIVNYATFEAARTGAVNHALPEPMRHELGTRLAPLTGGDGSMMRAAAGIARMRAEIDSAVGADGRAKPPTELRIINPTAAAFASWGRHSEDAGREVIPNSHLRHRARESRGTPPLTLSDANLLKIEVTHGLDLKVPLVNGLLTKALAGIDPDNARWYAANRYPLRSVATVRMQSEAWSDAVEAGDTSAPPADGGSSDVAPGDVVAGGDVPSGLCEGVDGTPSSPVLYDSAAYEAGHCGAVDTGFGTPGSPGPTETVIGEDDTNC